MLATFLQHTFLVTMMHGEKSLSVRSLVYSWLLHTSKQLSAKRPWNIES